MAQLDPTDGARDRAVEAMADTWTDLSHRYDSPPVESRNDTDLRVDEDLEAEREDKHLSWQLELGLVIDDRVKAYRPGFR